METTVRKYTFSRAMKQTCPTKIKSIHITDNVSNKQEDDLEELESHLNINSNNKNKHSAKAIEADTKKRTREEGGGGGGGGTGTIKHSSRHEKENIGVINNNKNIPSSSSTASLVSLLPTSSLQKKSKPNGLEEVVNNRVTTVAESTPVTSNCVKVSTNSNRQPSLSVSILHASSRKSEQDDDSKDANQVQLNFIYIF